MVHIYIYIYINIWIEVQSIYRGKLISISMGLISSLIWGILHNL